MTMRIGVHGIVAIYGSQLPVRLTEEQFKALIGEWFDADPLAHAMAMFACLAKNVDIVTLYRDMPDNQATARLRKEQALRTAWRNSIRYRFIHLTHLIWSLTSTSSRLSYMTTRQRSSSNGKTCGSKIPPTKPSFRESRR